MIIHLKNLLKKNKLINKFIESKNLFLKEINENNDETIGNLLWLDKLNLIKLFWLKDYFLKNNPLNYQDEYTNIEHLYIKHPIIFDNEFIAKLYMKTKGRIFYFFSSWSEDLIMKLIQFEDEHMFSFNFLESDYPLDKPTLITVSKGKEIPDYLRKRNLNFTDFIPENLYIETEYNKEKIKKFYPKYMYLLDEYPSLKELKKRSLKTLQLYNKEEIKKMKVYDWDRECQIYFLSNLFSNKEISNKDFEIFSSIIKKSKYCDSDFYSEIISRINNNFIQSEYVDFSLLNDEMKIRIYDKFPILKLFRTSTTENAENLESFVKDILNTYYELKKDRNYWNITDSQLRYLRNNLEDILWEKEFLYLKENKEILKEIIYINPDIYIYKYFKGKYDKDLLDYVSNLNIYKFDYISNEIDRNSRFRFEDIDIGLKIVEESFEIDLREKYINKRDFCSFIKNKKIFALKTVIDIFNDRRIDFSITEKLLNFYPKLLKEEAFVMDIKNIEIIENFLKKYPENYRYLYEKTLLRNETTINVIKSCEENIEYIPAIKLREKSLYKELIKGNKYFLKPILKKLKYDYLIGKYGCKKIDLEEFNNLLYNEFKRNNDAFYINFLPEDIIEALIIKDEIDFSNIKDKKVRRNLSKIYVDLKESEII